MIAVQASEEIVIGAIIAPHGVKGALRIKSECDPPEAIFKYKPWHLVPPVSAAASRSADFVATAIRLKGNQLVARLPDVESREDAEAIRIQRSQLPKLKVGEYYWHDLIGLRVVNLAEQELGVVEQLFATGSNDVMLVRGERERFLPYLPGRHVIEVDLAAGLMRVDWDAEF
jgi:16S rRNA processing protein RimM